MLVNLRFKNFRSFYNEANLSMQATTDKELRELNTFKVSGEELLKSTLIFGANASGKTNVIKALTYIKNAIIFSGVEVYKTIDQNEYFMFYDNAVAEDSLYEVEIYENKAFYTYGFIINGGKVKEEWLYRKVERNTPIFKRVGNKITITGENKELSNFININSSSLFISCVRNFSLNNVQYYLDVLNWFARLTIVMGRDDFMNSFDIYNVENNKYQIKAMEILHKADIGIKNFEVVKDKIMDRQILNMRLQNNREIELDSKYLGKQIQQNDEGLFSIDLKTTFDIYNERKEKIKEKEIMLLKEYGFNSEGTLKLLSYLGWILRVLDKGGVILIDELDSKLHFLVADYLVELFNSIDKNPKNAQLIGTVQNVMLMDEELRRDQIYFVSKDEFGESTLLSLADFKGVRKKDLFSKKYLAGFYSKLPNLNREV